MNDRFERMVDLVLKYKPPPRGKKAEKAEGTKQEAAKKKKKGKKS